MLLLSTATSSFAWWSSAARELHERGFTTLPGRVDAHLVEHMRHASVAELEQQLVEVGAAGCDVLEQQYSFNSICHRQRLRWDVRLSDTPEWHQFRADALRLVEAGLEQPLRVLMSGVVVSRSGADGQRFHADGNSELLTCFVPLVDIAADSDGTQFWPGSHEDDHGPTLAPTLAWDDARMAEMAAPGCAAGGVLAFDYRVIHRGLPNAGRDRPVAYLVVAPEDDAGLEDALNFPGRRVADARPADVAAFPRWDEID